MKAQAAFLAVVVVAIHSASALAEAVVIDHRCTDVNRVPEEFIRKAKDAFKVAYGHTSHGSQVVDGMKALEKVQPELFAFDRKDRPATLQLLDRTPSGDLGNPNRREWAKRTRNLLRDADDVNLVMWSWCGQVGNASPRDIDTYLGLMSALERDFPEVTFVYMTGHLNGTGEDGNLHKRNEQIREFCRQHDKVLFDFAGIESYDPDGRVNYMKLHATDGCTYRLNGKTRNWAAEWVRKNPGDIPLPDRAAHTHALNAALKGRAFWWMLARLAGWQPEANR